jgi:prepilin-type N-terminal cleavage/methylation domain-containing protein
MVRLHTRQNTATRRRGFTILELLIAVIIIGILVAIIIPIYVSRANEARFSAAQADLDSLQSAEQHAAIDTGYFYRLYTLNDMKGGEAIPSSNLTGDRIDGIRDEQYRTDVGTPKRIFIDTVDGTILANDYKYDTLAQNETSFNWNGPYLNFSRKTGLKIQITIPGAGGIYPADLPVDPWNNVYMLFMGPAPWATTGGGLMDDRSGTIVTSYTGNDGGSYNTQIFDRPTVLSLGPNGIPGNGATSTEPNFGQGDDMMRQF